MKAHMEIEIRVKVDRILHMPLITRYVHNSKFIRLHFPNMLTPSLCSLIVLYLRYAIVRAPDLTTQTVLPQPLELVADHRDLCLGSCNINSLFANNQCLATIDACKRADGATSRADHRDTQRVGYMGVSTRISTTILDTGKLSGQKIESNILIGWRPSSVGTDMKNSAPLAPVKVMPAWNWRASLAGAA